MIAVEKGDAAARRKRKKLLSAVLAAAAPLLILFLRPLGMDLRQSGVVALLVLVITWWCTGAVDKTIASCVLLAGFLLFSGAPAKTIFSFPLSNTFPLIVLTYLFSRGVTNSGLAERYLEPLLFRFATTPIKAMFSLALMFAVTIYAIPQPLARLIIVSGIFSGYLNKTDAGDDLKRSLMFSAFVIYIFINMCTMRADIIVNTTAVRASGADLTDIGWIRYMAVPSLVYLALAVLLMRFVFRREMRSGSLKAEAAKPTAAQGKGGPLMPALLLVTVALWFTESLHGIPAWAVTLASVGVMFCAGVLKPKDIRAIDVPMLVFLTAAMCIGGVMTASGTAGIVFSALRGIIPHTSVLATIFVIMLISMCMHMLLGSNTTTVSVVIPGIVYICGDVLPVPVILLAIYITVATQWLFPFHSVGMMIGSSKGYFPLGYMLRMGVPLTLLVFLAVAGIYVPWWRLIGLL